MTNTHNPNPTNSPAAIAGVWAAAVLVSGALLFTTFEAILPLFGAILTTVPAAASVIIAPVVALIGVSLILAAGAVLVGAWEYARPLYTDPADIAAAHRRENLDIWADYMTDDYRSGRMGPR